MPDMERERDLVLNPNEFAYVLDKTKGLISCVVGSYKMSLSTSDSLVVFNKDTKKFEEATFSEAISTFVTAPENWYIELKNPARDNSKHPAPGTANPATDLLVGKKVNIPGNVTFALYPGQMAKTIRGHRLHSNQYLLARVYDADVLTEKVSDTPALAKPASDIEELDNILNADTGEAKKYTVGQLLVIKGTEVPFYIPPTGIEVIPKGGSGTEYVRDAVTLERLEYCILKNESGNKKYIHGPSVVFPEPDEVFITNPETKDYKFRAIELSEIMGLYIKVISDYTENDKQYHAGEELFITGKDQMIYYPRPEHAIIDYDGKIAHHAIAIPRGEGRYVLNRKTGNIKMVVGPAMYLPDPRNEVIVKRKLSKRECELWYPGNKDVLEYNIGITLDDLGTTAMFSAISPEKFASTKAATITHSIVPDTLSYESLDTGFLGKANVSTDKNSRISRGNKYSKPRTITIDNKFDGVVSIDVFTGYAINVVSKEGTRKVIVGPKTYLLEYDETLEALSLSTGKPKTTDELFHTVYLRVENNKISDIVYAQTSDFVKVSIKLSYCVDFKLSHKDKWFSIDNYVKFLTDRLRSLLKREIQQHTIEDFYNNSTDIVRNIVVGKEGEDGKVPGKMFNENGMFIYDVEVLDVSIDDPAVDSLIKEHQTGIVQKSLELTNANKEILVAEKLAEVEATRYNLEHKNKLYALNLKTEYELKQLTQQDSVRKMREKADKETSEAKLEIQEVLNKIVTAELERSKEKSDYELSVAKEQSELKIKNQESYASSVQAILESLSEDLAASMVSRANAELLKEVATAISPYALATGDSIADTVNTLLGGTPLEALIRQVKQIRSEDD